VLGKLNTIRPASLRSSQQCDDAGGNLHALFVSDLDQQANCEFTIGLNRRSVLVQVGRFRRYAEGTLLTIFARHTDRCLQRHAVTAAFGNLASSRSADVRCVCRVGLRVGVGMFQAHVVQ